MSHLLTIRGKSNRAGFTLVELMIAVMILVGAVAGILLSYLRCLELNEISRCSSRALQAANSRMEQVKSTAFNQIKPNFHLNTYTVSGLNAGGVSYVDDSNPDLLLVTTSVCWRLSNGRMFGEDLNLDGQLQAGEDQNGNGILDSPVQIVNAIFRR